MRILRFLPLAFAVSLLLGALPFAASARHQMLPRTRGGQPAPGKGQAAATRGLPPGSQQLISDDGSFESAIGVRNDAGDIGNEAVFLNRFTPPPDQLPLTIDTVSILFPLTDPTTGQSTNVTPGMTFQVLVYLDENGTGNPVDATLVRRQTIDILPSDTQFQDVSLDAPVTLTRGSIYLGFTDVVTSVIGTPVYSGALDVDTVTTDSLIFFNTALGSHFNGEHLADATSGPVMIHGTWLIRGFYSTGGSVQICWDTAAGNGAPPTNTRVCSAPSRSLAAGTSAVRDETPMGYKVYRSTQPGVQPSPSTFFTSVPPNQTTAASGVAPTGSFFVVTAEYPSGDSGPSNEVGVRPASIFSLKVKSTKIVAKGADFSPAVLVLVDGIPFVSPATVKNGTKVTQKGTLLTGESVRAYLAAHGGTARVSFRNANGTTATFTAHQ